MPINDRVPADGPETARRGDAFPRHPENHGAERGAMKKLNRACTNLNPSINNSYLLDLGARWE